VHEVTQRLIDALHGSHVIETRVQIQDDLGDIIVPNLTVEDGQVQLDDKNDIRRRANIRLYDYDGMHAPKEWNDILHPFSGNRLLLKRGVRFGPNDYDLVDLGMFDPYAVDITDSGENVNIGVDCYDLSRKIQRSRLLQPYQIEAGTNYRNAIRDLLLSRVPNLKLNFATVPFVTPELRFGASGEHQGGGDIWSYALEMAQHIGHKLYFDTHGVLLLEPITSSASKTPVWHFHDDDASTMMSIQVRKTMEETYNHVLVTGTTGDDEPPVRGEAWDDNPNSSTYAGAVDPNTNQPDGDSVFGDIPTFITSEHVRTEEQAEAVAHARLEQVLGYQQTMNITSVPIPVIEGGDVIHIKRERIGVYDLCIVDKYSMSLSASQGMNITMRERRMAM
jgi:hypothetical protein